MYRTRAAQFVARLLSHRKVKQFQHAHDRNLNPDRFEVDAWHDATLGALPATGGSLDDKQNQRRGARTLGGVRWRASSDPGGQGTDTALSWPGLYHARLIAWKDREFVRNLSEVARKRVN
jgi:hypothetical protein